tara:strand:+ start:19891 stop:20526 length:636 start_codon:yes stop_codon:yes gene_type:complete
MGNLESLSKDLLEKIEDGYTQKFHFLESAKNEPEIAKIISGFANTTGGVLLIGIKTNGKVIGVNPSHVLKEIDLISEKLMIGRISIKLEKTLFGRHFLILIQITSLNSKVAVRVNGSTTYFLRVDSLTVSANKIILKAWSLLKQKKIIKLIDVHDEILHLCDNKDFISLSFIYQTVNYRNKLLDLALSELIALNKMRVIPVQNEIRYSSLC